VGIGLPAAGGGDLGHSDRPQRTPVELATPERVIVKLVSLGIGFAALYAAGASLVWIFAGLVVVNEVRLLAWTSNG
jgi:hypothetical protein